MSREYLEKLRQKAEQIAKHGVGRKEVYPPRERNDLANRANKKGRELLGVFKLLNSLNK